MHKCIDPLSVKDSLCMWNVLLYYCITIRASIYIPKIRDTSVTTPLFWGSNHLSFSRIDMIEITYFGNQKILLESLTEGQWGGEWYCSWESMNMYMPQKSLYRYFNELPACEFLINYQLSLITGSQTNIIETRILRIISIVSIRLDWMYLWMSGRGTQIEK